MIHMDAIRNREGEKIDASFHEGTRGGTLVILGHGVTGNKDRPLLRALAKGLSSRGWPCLRISFSGNGDSQGNFGDSCISKGCSDLRSVLDQVPEETRIAYAGHSMGAAVGVITAAQDPRIRVLVSLAGMTHTAAFLRREFGDVIPDQGCMWDDPRCPLSTRFANDLIRIGDVLEAAGRIVSPWLLLHGGKDDVVPLSDGLDAFAAARSARHWVEFPEAGHSFGEDSYPAIIAAMDDWFSLHLLPPGI